MWRSSSRNFLSEMSKRRLNLEVEVSPRGRRKRQNAYLLVRFTSQLSRQQEREQARTYGALRFTTSASLQARQHQSASSLRSLLSSQRQRRTQHGCSCSTALRLTFCMRTELHLPRLGPDTMPLPHQEYKPARSPQPAHLETQFYHKDT
jgi:hypothetical protein